MELHLKLVGILLLVLALVHVGIPGYFKWKTEIGGVSLLTRQILYVHTFFIGLIVLLMGLLCVFYSQELLTQRLGRVICLGLAVFWSFRAFFQFFVYSPKLWLGKAFETTVHVIFSLSWLYFASVFFAVFLDIQLA